MTDEELVKVVVNEPFCVTLLFFFERVDCSVNAYLWNSRWHVAKDS